MININNYEAYLLDLWEGNISAEDKEALYAFLKLHPELKEDIDIHIPVLSTDEVGFNKEALQYDTITSENREYFFIAYFENELTSIEKGEVDEFLKDNPQYVEEFNQFKKTQLKAPEIIFEDKKSLLPQNTVSIRKWVVRIAAALLLLLGGQFLSVLIQNDEFSSKRGEVVEYKKLNFSERSFIKNDFNSIEKEEKTPVKDSENDVQPNFAQYKEEINVPNHDHEEKQKRIISNMNMMDKIEADEVLLTTAYDKNPAGVPLDKIIEKEGENEHVNDLAALSPKEFLLGWAKNKLKKNNNADQKSQSKDELSEYDQTILALGVNKGLDLITGEDQKIAITGNEKKRTFFKWGSFSFEKVSSMN